MRSFRAHAAWWFSIWFSVLSAVLFAGLLICVYASVTGREKNRLRELASDVEQKIAGVQRLDSEAVRDAVGSVNEGITRLRDEENLDLGYAVYSPGGDLLYKFHRMAKDPFFDEGSVTSELRYFEARWINHRKGLFFRRIKTGRFSVVAASYGKFGLIDDVITAYLIIFPFGIVLSVMAGFHLGRRLTGPLLEVAATARKIESGDLGARVSAGGRFQETEYAADVLNAAFSELDRSFKQIEQFSSNVAHELKTPLTSLRGSMEVALRRSRPAEEYKEVLAAAIDDIDEITGIVENLLMLARPGGDAARKVFVDVDIRSVLEIVCSNTAPLAARNNVAVKLQSTTGISVRGNRMLLERAFHNLVHNAIKYSNAGGIVDVSLTAADGNVKVTVTDSGCGISESDRERVFDRFFRCPGDNTAGHGLGLAIVKWIIELHQGAIEVQGGMDGSGSRFIVRLPVASTATQD